MEQLANPTIANGRNNHTCFFAFRSQPGRHCLPMGIVTHQAVSRFHDDLAEQFVSGLDEAAGRRFAATGIVARADRTKMSELLLITNYELRIMNCGMINKRNS
jgi:hypothetical protein